tara:strand:- start:5462 stop:5878 length:417 start_codon:yes stop_codon:yes gene_type:complete
MSKDLHNRIKVTSVIHPQAGATASAVSAVVDRAGFAALEFVCSYGVWTTTSADFVVTVKDGDTTGAVSNAVNDTELISTEALAGVAAAATVDTNVAKKIGYIGDARYVSVTIKADTATGFISAIAIQSGERKSPHAQA